jgi:hypothetical protein
MSEIKIPFKQWSKERLNFNKRATSRTKIYGKLDDDFYVDGVKFAIVGVVKLPTDFIIRHLYHIEGADSSSELEKIFKDIFKNKPLPYWMYVHFFERVDE